MPELFGLIAERPVNVEEKAQVKQDVGRLMSEVSKPTNPKDAVGIKKAPITTVPLTVVAELGIGMLEGARKYGRHNYRVDGVRASVYVDATWRHLAKWWEGEDIDPDSGLSHITKALASLAVLRDAMINNKFHDDRPPKAPEGFFAELDKAAAAVIAKYPDPKEAFTELNFRVKPEEIVVALSYQIQPKGL